MADKNEIAALIALMKTAFPNYNPDMRMTAELMARTLADIPGETLQAAGLALVTEYGRAFAPHISLWIVSRGINIGLQTRIYFADEDNEGDPLLSRIEQRPRVDTLIAKRTGEGTYRFDIRLQGEGETVFLDI